MGDEMNRAEATKFVNDWLWDSGESIRETEGMLWMDEYKQDVISMIVDATKEM